MHIRFENVFSRLTKNLQTAIYKIISDIKFSAVLTIKQVNFLKNETGLEDESLAIALLPIAASYARVDVSNFRVGAIARGISGNWYFGSNIEFLGTTMQYTIHAEQSSISNAWMCGEKSLDTITVNYKPCGHCRQFMNELNSNKKLRIHLSNGKSYTLNELLPYSFGPKDLGVEKLLMDKQNHSLSNDSNDTLIQAAISAANISYIPYSKSPSGIAIKCNNGRIFIGSYAENAAFNPTLSPFQSAINLLILSGYDYSDIQCTVLVEKSNSSVIQWYSTVVVLKALGCENIYRVLLK